MEKYVIKGGNPLVGEVEIGGAKNAALAILAAATMTDETVYIDNMPDASDTNAMLQAIESIGAFVERTGRHSVKINASQIKLKMIISRRSGQVTTSLVLFLVSIRMLELHFPVAVTSAFVLSTSISRALLLLEPRSTFRTSSMPRLISL